MKNLFSLNTETCKTCIHIILVCNLKCYIMIMINNSSVQAQANAIYLIDIIGGSGSSSIMTITIYYSTTLLLIVVFWECILIEVRAQYKNYVVGFLKLANAHDKSHHTHFGYWLVTQSQQLCFVYCYNDDNCGNNRNRNWKL